MSAPTKPAEKTLEDEAYDDVVGAERALDRLVGRLIHMDQEWLPLPDREIAGFPVQGRDVLLTATAGLRRDIRAALEVLETLRTA